MTFPTVDRLRQLFSYDATTGVLYWNIPKSNRVKSGDVAGCAKGRVANQHLAVSIDGRSYKVHRVVWCMSTGEWPTSSLDHKDGNPFNNRLSNLRECSSSENSFNRGPQRTNTTGFKGVTLDKTGKFQAQISVNRRYIYLGRFSTALEAHAAYEKAAIEFHGAFARAA